MMKIAASYEGVQALRDFAEAMPYAVGQISESTQRLRTTYNSLEDYLGARSEAFRCLVEDCVRATAVASDAIEDLPIGLATTADELESWLDKQIGIEGSSDSGIGGETRRGPMVLGAKGATRR